MLDEIWFYGKEYYNQTDKYTADHNEQCLEDIGLNDHGFFYSNSPQNPDLLSLADSTGIDNNKYSNDRNKQADR